MPSTSSTVKQNNLDIPSPCIGICSTSIGDSICRGCKRFATEIVNWNRYNLSEKKAIEQRLQQLLIHVLSDRMRVCDAQLLAKRLEDESVSYARHRPPLCWVNDLLHSPNLSSLDDLPSYGIECVQPYTQTQLNTLRDEIDDDFYALSSAYYKRYQAADS